MSTEQFTARYKGGTDRCRVFHEHGQRWVVAVGAEAKWCGVLLGEVQGFSRLAIVSSVRSQKWRLDRGSGLN